MRPDRHLHPAGVELARKPQEGYVGLLAPGMGDLGALEVGALHKQNREPGPDEVGGVLGAPVQVGLQCRHDGRTLGGELGHEPEDPLDAAAVVRAYLQARVGRQALDDLRELTPAEVLGDVDVHVGEVDPDVHACV